MATFITRVVVALNPDGSHKGAAVYEASEIDGQVFDRPIPRGIAAADTGALAAIFDPAYVAALAELEQVTAERDAAQADLTQATAELEALKASLLPVDENGVPTSVTRFQARAALHLAGLLSTVEAMMSNPATDAIARIAWQDAQNFERSSPTVAGLAAALGLTDAQLDGLFIQAAAIKA